MGGSVNGDIQKWMGYFMENPKIKWMIQGTPILGNLYMYIYILTCIYKYIVFFQDVAH